MLVNLVSRPDFMSMHVVEAVLPHTFVLYISSILRVTRSIIKHKMLKTADMNQIIKK